MPSRLKTTVLVLLGFLAPLVVSEALIAVFLDRPSWVEGCSWCLAGLRNTYFQEDWRVPQSDPTLTRYDPELTYLLRPGRWPFSNREFHTVLEVNTAGLRDDETSLRQPEIIVLGDSYAMGWGVGQHETFPELLEQAGPKVLNAGVSSYGTARQVLLLERLDGSRLRAVVVQYHFNDYAENLAFLNGQEPASRAEFRLAAEAWQDRLRYRPGDYLRAFLRPLSHADFLPPSANEEDAARTALDILDGSEALADVPLYLLETDPWGAPVFNVLDEMAALLAGGEYPDLEGRTTIVPLAGVLGSADFFQLDPHPNASGHMKIAAELIKALRIGS